MPATASARAARLLSMAISSSSPRAVVLVACASSSIAPNRPAWFSGLTASTVRPISSIWGMESLSLAGTMTRSGASAAQPSKSNSLAVPMLGRDWISGADRL